MKIPEITIRLNETEFEYMKEKELICFNVSVRCGEDECPENKLCVQQIEVINEYYIRVQLVKTNAWGLGSVFRSFDCDIPKYVSGVDSETSPYLKAVKFYDKVQRIFKGKKSIGDYDEI